MIRYIGASSLGARPLLHLHLPLGLVVLRWDLHTLPGPGHPLPAWRSPRFYAGDRTVLSDNAQLAGQPPLPRRPRRQPRLGHGRYARLPGPAPGPSAEPSPAGSGSSTARRCPRALSPWATSRPGPSLRPSITSRPEQTLPTYPDRRRRWYAATSSPSRSVSEVIRRFRILGP